MTDHWVCRSCGQGGTSSPTWGEFHCPECGSKIIQWDDEKKEPYPGIVRREYDPDDQADPTE